MTTTPHSYDRVISEFAAFCGCEPFSLTEGEFNRKLQEFVSSQDCAPATVNFKISAIQGIAKYKRRFGETGIVPTVTRPKNEPTVIRAPLPKGVVTSFLKEEVRSNAQLRDMVGIGFMFLMGLRRSEICCIKFEDVNLEQGTVAVTRKGYCNAEIKLVPTFLLDLISKWSERVSNPTGPLLRAVGRDDRISINGLSAHALNEITHRVLSANAHSVRHTAICAAADVCAEKGLGLQNLMSFSGHKSLTSLTKYLDKSKEAALSISEALM